MAYDPSSTTREVQELSSHQQHVGSELSISEATTRFHGWSQLLPDWKNPTIRANDSAKSVNSLL